MIRRLVSFIAPFALAACIIPPQQQAQPGAQAGQAGAQGGTAACPQACQNYARCKGLTDPTFADRCSQSCGTSGADPALVQQAATGDCPTVIALFEGQGAGQGGAVAAGGAAGAPAAGAPSCPAVQAAPGQDEQLAQLLSRTAWCYYSFTGSTETKERVVMTMDGHAVSNGNSETSYSGDNRNQYGEQTQTWGATGAQASGKQGCWKVLNGQLQLSADGQQWAAVPTTVTQNSNGYPIVNAGGKEFASCN